MLHEKIATIITGLFFFHFNPSKTMIAVYKVPCPWKTNLVTLMKRKQNVIENVIQNYSSLILQVCNFPDS